MTAIIDTNSLIYLSDPNSKFHVWAKDIVENTLNDGPIILPDIAWAEFAYIYDNITQVREALPSYPFERLALDDESLFKAAQAFKVSNQSNANEQTNRKSILPDYFIGAQATVHQCKIITNDISIYQSYFPEVQLLHPHIT